MSFTNLTSSIGQLAGKLVGSAAAGAFVRGIICGPNLTRYAPTVADGITLRTGPLANLGLRFAARR